MEPGSHFCLDVEPEWGTPMETEIFGKNVFEIKLSRTRGSS
jgi:hypothetical protein